MFNNRCHHHLLMMGIVIIGLSGCASVSVTSMQEPPPAAKLVLPETVYVEKFAATDEVLRVDREGMELTEFKQKLQSQLAMEIIERVTKNIAPAKLWESTSPRPSTGWLVRGRFVRVNQGSRALRILIGLGLGGTKMETDVAVFDLAQSNTKPFITFCTTGGSNAEPGAITGAASTGPIDAAVGTALGVALVLSHGVTEDAKKTAHEITAVLSEYAGVRGWLLPRQTLEYKRLEVDSEKLRKQQTPPAKTTGSSQNSKR